VYAPAGTEISNPWRSGSDVDPRMEASFPGVATPSAILTAPPTVSVPRAREDGVIAGAGLLLVAVADGPELLQLAMTRVAIAITHAATSHLVKPSLQSSTVWATLDLVPRTAPKHDFGSSPEVRSRRPERRSGPQPRRLGSVVAFLNLRYGAPRLVSE